MLEPFFCKPAYQMVNTLAFITPGMISLPSHELKQLLNTMLFESLRHSWVYCDDALQICKQTIVLTLNYTSIPTQFSSPVVSYHSFIFEVYTIQ